MGIVLVGALLSFFFPGVGAYKWYRGERHTIDDFSVSISATSLFPPDWGMVVLPFLHPAVPCESSLHEDWRAISIKVMTHGKIGMVCCMM